MLATKGIKFLVSEAFVLVRNDPSTPAPSFHRRFLTSASLQPLRAQMRMGEIVRRLRIRGLVEG